MFGNNVQEIEAGAFAGCEDLSSVKFSVELRKIGANAFSDCENLVDMNIGAVAPNIVGSNAFSNTGLKNIRTKLCVYDKSATEIFSDCHALNDADITSNVIFDGMFNGCENLLNARLTYSDG